jgi:Colicin D
MNEPSTQIIEGTYRKSEVTHYFNPETGLNVFFDKNTKKFISGWLLRNKQFDNMVNRGAL